MQGYYVLIDFYLPAVTLGGRREWFLVGAVGFCVLAVRAAVVSKRNGGEGAAAENGADASLCRYLRAGAFGRGGINTADPINPRFVSPLFCTHNVGGGRGGVCVLGGGGQEPCAAMDESVGGRGGRRMAVYDGPGNGK